MVRRYALIILLILTLAVNLFSASDGGCRSPFAVGFGARQLGMGGASVALINSSSSIYWNPAGLASLNRSELHLFHMNLFMDTRYECMSFAYPTLSTGVFGAGIGDLSSGDFTRIDNYQEIGTFSTRQDLFLLGYGFSPVKDLLAGVTVKGAYYDFDGYKDTGFGFDLGLIYKIGYIQGLSSGLKISDIYGPRIKLHTSEQRFPTSVRGGLAYQRVFPNKYSLNLSIDFEKTEFTSSDIYSGIEFGIKDVIFTRLGYMSDRLTLGAGLSFYDFKFDYAYASHSDLDASHRLSLSYVFGTPVDIRRARKNEKIAQQRIDEFIIQEQLKDQETIQQELASAQKLEVEGEMYEAVKTYYKVLGIDDQNEVARNKVTALFKEIKLDVAREASQGYVDQLLAQQIELGNDYVDKKQYDKGEEQFKLALILDSDNQQAKDQLESIQRMKQNEIIRIKNRADNHLKNGDYDLALADLNRVIRLAPDDSRTKATQNEICKIFESSKLLDEAIMLFDQEKYIQAIAYVDSALVLNPKSDGAVSMRRQLTRYTAEVTILEDIKSNADHWQIYIQGMEKYQAGEYEEALRLWRSLLEYYPNNLNLKRNIDQSNERLEKK